MCVLKRHDAYAGDMMDDDESGRPSGNDTLTDHVRGWYERSATAQRALARLRTDLDSVRAELDATMAQAQPKIEGFWRQISPIIDPPPTDDAPRR